MPVMDFVHEILTHHALSMMNSWDPYLSGRSFIALPRPVCTWQFGKQTQNRTWGLYSTGHYKIKIFFGSGGVPVNWNCVFISPCFAKFKNVAHSLEPGETLSYSASHQTQNYLQRSQISQNISKRFGLVTVRLRLFIQFT